MTKINPPAMCPCGVRPAAQCDEQWGPKCDLGSNEKYAKVAELQPAVNVKKDRLLRLPQVESIVGIRKSTIYVLMKQGNFPQPVHVTPRHSAWPESAVYQWVQDQINKAQG